MSSSKWVPVCKWCGLRLNAKVVTANGLNPPSRPPKDCEAYGAPLATYGCSESPNGNHTYMWERWLKKG